ncbi:MAG: sensor histidine kinase [Armatimonadota bacterium]
MASLVSSDFLAVMCHQIRTPLAGILGFADLIEAVGPLTERQARYVSGIKAGSNRLVAMLSAVLDYAHPERGIESLQCRRFVPVEVVRQALETVQGKAQERGMSIEIAEEGPQRHLFADPQRFAYAVETLLVMLVEGCPRGSRIAVTVRSRHNGCEVLIGAEGGAAVGPDWDLILKAYDDGAEAVLGRTQRVLAFNGAVARRLIEMHGGYVRTGAPDSPDAVFAIWLPDTSQLVAGG